MNEEKGTKDVFILHHYNLSSIFSTNPSTLTHTRDTFPFPSPPSPHTHKTTFNIAAATSNEFNHSAPRVRTFSTPLFESTLFQSIPQRRHIGEEDKWKSGWRRVSPPLTLIHVRINREIADWAERWNHFFIFLLAARGTATQPKRENVKESE